MNFNHPTLAQIPQLRQLWQEAFDDSDAFLDQFFHTAFSADRCLCAEEDQQVVAVAYWFSCEEYAYIYAVATAKAYQGRGICHRLMEHIHKILASRGYHGAVLVPGDASLRQFYRGMGYENFGGMDTFTCEASTPLPLRIIDAAEFQQLRRQYLPDGGVIQEGENLKFLSCSATFYAGADFLLTAVETEGRLLALELLGNRTAAPGILATLKISCGTFHCPGSTPFAMWLPFDKKIAPTYFGFAFD